jgi:hypothetical protein
VFIPLSCTTISLVKCRWIQINSPAVTSASAALHSACSHPTPPLRPRRYRRPRSAPPLSPPPHRRRSLFVCQIFVVAIFVGFGIPSSLLCSRPLCCHSAKHAQISRRRWPDLFFSHTQLQFRLLYECFLFPFFWYYQYLYPSYI